MSQSYPMYIDRRDAAVVDQLEEGEVYDVTHITSLYRRYTDITRDKTAKQRKKNLVNSPCFEYVRIGVFQFVGFDQ